MYAVIGLGNNGAQYERTRHNAGFIIVDRLVQESDWAYDKYARADLVYGHIGDHEVVYAKPRTLMNRSGQTVEYLIEKHTLVSEHIIVVHDDIDLPVGYVRVSLNRGHGGNNGIRSIFQHIGSTKIVRIRVGVSHVRPDDTSKILKQPVLGEFSKEDYQAILALAPDISSIIRTIVTQSPEHAMNEVNERP